MAHGVHAAPAHIQLHAVGQLLVFGNLDFHGGLVSFKQGKLGLPRFRVGVNTIIANTAAAAWLLGLPIFQRSKQ